MLPPTTSPAVKPQLRGARQQLEPWPAQSRTCRAGHDLKPHTASLPTAAMRLPLPLLVYLQRCAPQSQCRRRCLVCSVAGTQPRHRLRAETDDATPVFVNPAELETIFLEPQNGIFWVGCVYGRNDDASRFGWFCGAAAEYIRTSENR